MGGVSSAWADDAVLLDFTLKENDGVTAGTQTLSGGSITFNTTAFELKNDSYGTKLDTDNKNIKIELSAPLQANDIISIKEFSSKNPTSETAYGISIKDENNESVVTTLYRAISAKKTIETVNYTVQSDDALCGKTTFYIVKSGSSIYFNGITITRKSSSNSFTLTTADTEFYSLYLDYAVTIPENVTAYTGSLDADESVLTVSEIEGDVIPAETAVLVKSSVAGTYTFEETDETATVGATALKGVLAETDATALAETGKVVLTLGMKDNKIGFRKPAEGKIGANKVYLLVRETNAAKGVSISFGGDTTGISEIGVRPAANAPLYNLAGQRVGEGTKGLLIKNGRKYINK